VTQRPKDDAALLERALEAAREETAAGLDEIRAQAVYRRVESGLPERGQRRASWRVLWLATPVAAAAAAAALVLWLRVPEVTPNDPAPRLAQVELTPARVVFRNGEVDLQQAADGAALPDDTTRLERAVSLELAPRARVDLEVEREARVAAFGPARLRRGGDGRFKLIAGTAQFSVEPHPADAPFTVQAGDVEVTVLGTEFVLDVRDGKLASLSVLEGTVELRPRDGGAEAVLRLVGGEAFKAPGAAAPATQPPAEVFAAPWWRGAVADRDRTGYLVVESVPSGALVSLAGQRIGETPLLVRWPAGAHEVMVELAGKQSWQGAARLAAGELRRITARLGELGIPTTAPVARKRPARDRDPWKIARSLLDARRCKKLGRLVRELVAQGSGDTDRARAELLGAECYLRQGEKRRALKLYQQLSRRYPETKGAEAALFEIAKLHAELGRARQGLAGMERYLERYPAGRFAEAATMRRCELLTGFKQLAKARSCLEGYRKSFPGGLRSAQAVLLLATIGRVEGRWADAAWLYRDYLARAPASPKAEGALYNLVRCLRWGRIEGAEEAIAEYLRRFPEGPHAEEVEQWRERATSQPRDR